MIFMPQRPLPTLVSNSVNYSVIQKGIDQNITSKQLLIFGSEAKEQNIFSGNLSHTITSSHVPRSYQKIFIANLSYSKLNFQAHPCKAYHPGLPSRPGPER